MTPSPRSIWLFNNHGNAGQRTFPIRMPFYKWINEFFRPIYDKAYFLSELISKKCNLTLFLLFNHISKPPTFAFLLLYFLMLFLITFLCFLITVSSILLQKWLWDMTLNIGKRSVRPQPINPFLKVNIPSRGPPRPIPNANQPYYPVFRENKDFASEARRN